MSSEATQVHEASARYLEKTDAQCVPPGYKRTEIGVIPEDWDVVSLDTICSRIGDGIHATPVYAKQGEYHFINGNNIRDGRIVITNGTKSVDSSEFKKYRTNLGDLTVLLSINGSIGNLALFANEPVVLGKSAAYLTIKSDINRNYFFYVLQAEPVNKQFNDGLTGTTIKNLGLGTIRATQIPIPPTAEEQRAIAEALSDVDGLLGALAALIAKKRAIKQAAMQQLFTGKTRLPGFSGEWETKRLGEIASFFKGTGLSKADLTRDGKTRCIHYGELFTAYGERITDVRNGTDREGAFFCSVANDVLMPTSDVTPTGLATASCILLSGIILGGDILVIRASEHVLKGEFLAYAVKVHRNQVMQLVSGTTVFHLYGRDMANFQLPAPSVEEQSAIAAVLSDMDAEITALEHRRDKTKQIKQGMMQQLLTGRVRLVKPAVGS